MFGDRKKLILPLVFDIANLVKTAASTHTNKRYREYSPYVPAYNEMIPQPEFLRRNDVIQDTTLYKNESVASLMTSQLLPVNNIKDDRFLIDIGEARIKNVVVQNGAEKMTSPSSHINDNRSYHERKLNMTAFNVNGTKDQYAVESTVQLQITTLPKTHENRPNMTLEEYEELAFHQLNGTIRSSNGSSIELLPRPEMLISRYRVKPPFRKFPQPSVGSSIDSISSSKTCERFGTLCLRVDDYPITQIMGSIRRHKHAMSALLAEYTDKEDFDYTTYLQELQENNSKR